MACTRPSRIPPRLLVPFFLVISAGCTPPDDTAKSNQIVLTEAARVDLQETSENPLGEIGTFAEAENGDFLISDAHQPQLRRYTSDGRLQAHYGSFGSGPGEFRLIGGVVEDHEQHLLVVDPALGRTTRLTPSLEFDTAYIQQPRPRGISIRFRGGILLTTAPGDRATEVTYFADAGGPTWSVPAPAPPRHYPYWGSIFSTIVAAAPDEFLTGYSLSYPILIHGRDGSVVDSLPQPPDFRQASVPEAGAFSGTGGNERLVAWLESFDVIAGLAVVSDTLLVVTHGTMSGDPATRFEILHERMDVYHLPGRERVAHDVELLRFNRVLGGGRYLHVLVGQPPDAWSIRSVDFAVAETEADSR